jgi:cellulose/xylan binding protein with CBM9 domain
MRVLAGIISLFFLSCAVVGESPVTVESTRASRDVSLSTDPASSFWQSASRIYARVDEEGHEVAGLRSEILSRWTKDNIYFLFICPYKHLYVKPNPDVQHETYELWNWNVAEVFIGTDFTDIKRYKEFEVSPHNEWIDLDINLHSEHHEDGWKWNSGFEHAARIDETRHAWYVAMKIPFTSLNVPAPAPGMKFRVNFYRTEGGGSDSKEVMWQAVNSKTFHTPERFGVLKLAAK